MIFEQYVDLGISVIPISPGTKDPYFQRLQEVGWHDEKGSAIWHPATREIAPPEVLERWFGDGQASIALVAGKVSNNLVYVDWDNAIAYRKWALDHKEIINRTPVSKTAAGYHVFFRTPEPVGGSHLYYKDAHVGHIRGDGMYVVAPPSRHPSGIEYTWLRHPSEGVAEIESLASIDIYAPVTDELPVDYSTEPVPVTDEVILIRAASAKWCRALFAPLWLGEWRKPRSGHDPQRQRYPSQSEGDLALCRILAFWTGRDAPRIERMFRRSGLYRRDKWNKVHFPVTGETYGQHTILVACLSTSKVFKVHRKYQSRWRQI